MPGIHCPTHCKRYAECLKTFKRKIFRKKVKTFSIQAIVGFVLWTTLLTPYMFLVTGLTFIQYLSWVAMEATIVPPIAVLVVRVTNWAVRKYTDES